MIGVFDSGHGGLTVMAELLRRFPQRRFVYFGDHAHAPYGDKTREQITAHTQAGLEVLFAHGCTLALLACNTASTVARALQTQWLPAAHPGKKILGIIAPTVEAATQTPWSVKTPQFPQKYNTDTIALFGTSVTVGSGVFESEVAKRCPRAKVVGQACPTLVPLLERGAPESNLRTEVEKYVAELLAKSNHTPEWAILGCTHYPLISPLFRAALPAATRLLDQPLAVANALEDYLSRHPEFDSPTLRAEPVYLTSGHAPEVSRVAKLFTGRTYKFITA